MNFSVLQLAENCSFCAFYSDRFSTFTVFFMHSFCSNRLLLPVFLKILYIKAIV